MLAELGDAMQGIWDYVRDNPWLWLLFGVSAAIWAASIAVIVRSPKFLRKWLWFLLSLFAVRYSWSISDDTMIGIGFPIGSLYILWFWRFGRPPTPEEIERRVARRGANTNSFAAVVVLRAIYLGAAVSFGVLGWLSASGAAIDAIGMSRIVHPLPEVVVVGMDAIDVTFFLLMLFLAYRPYWWGKIICLWAGLSWIGFAVMTSYLSPSVSVVSAVVFICGVFMLAAAVVHQIVDPRFSGSYLRTAIP